MSISIKKAILKNSFWAIIGQFGSLIIALFANIWLARILSSEIFGQLGIIIFFISVFTVISEGGLSGALIRKTKISNEDYSTTFIFNLAVSVFCFLLILLFSDSISNYYQNPELKLPLLASGFILIFNALFMVQDTRLIYKMNFKRKSFYDITSALISSALGILLAYRSFGLWSLVILYLSRAFIKMSMLWIFEGFYFKLIFSKHSFKNLYGFGINTTLSSILNIAFDNIYQLIIGKIFTINQVGYYFQAKRLNDVIPSLFVAVNQGPFFSGISKTQENLSDFRKIYFNALGIILSILGLIMYIIIAFSDEMIVFILGERWISSASYLRYITVGSFFYVLENYNRVVFKSFDKTKILLFLEIVKKIIQSLSIVLGIYFKDMKVLLGGLIFSNFIGYLINLYYSKKIIQIKTHEEIFLVFKIIVISILTLFLHLKIKELLDINGFYFILLLIFDTLVYSMLLFLLRVLSFQQIRISVKNILAHIYNFRKLR